MTNSMIQSLRSRLEELEKAETSPRTIERHVPAADNRTSTRTLMQSSQTVNLTLAPEVEESGRADLSKPAGKAHGVGLSLVTDTTQSQGEDAPADCSGMFYESQVAYNESPSGCIQPCSFERLMKPIDLAINRNGDAATPILGLDSGSAQAETAVSQMVSSCCTCDRLLDAMRWSLPLRRQADSLVTIYFSRHCRMFPILHQPTFMRQYERLWESTESLMAAQKIDCLGLCKQKSRGRLFPATLYTVLAMGALFASRSLERNAIQAATYFRQAQGIDLLEILDDEVGIELIQLGVLTGFYLQSTEKFSKCWNISGLTIRMAQNMGLHLGIAEAFKRGLFTSFPTQLECEMRRRVWYGCVLLETYVISVFHSAFHSHFISYHLSCLPIGMRPLLVTLE